MAELTLNASSPDGMFGTKAGTKSCKLPSKEDTGTSPRCPRCGSQKIWRNGARYLMFGGKIQRWLCRECGSRFSDPNDLKAAIEAVETVEMIETESLKSKGNIDNTRQICDEETSRFSVNPTRGTKNLATELSQEKLVVPQKEAYDIKDLKGAVVEFLYYLQNNEKAPSTKSHYVYSLEYLISNGANLFDPLSVKITFAEKLKDKTDARKYCILKAYKAFANAYGIDITSAKFKKYKPTRALPYIPPEAHMDVLIASCSYEMAAFLQTLKETAARPIEAMRILRDEVDFIQNHLPINHPAKNCNPRNSRITEKLATMLKTLPIVSNGKLFRYKNERVAAKTFKEMRKRAIVKLGIAELRKIHFYTFRYWRATVELQETGREVDVAYLLGHTSNKYVTKYAQLAKIYFGGTKKYKSVWATSREQETQLADDGYEYVRTDPKDGASLYRKLDHLAASTLIGHD